MRDEDLAPKGWPIKQHHRQNLKMSEWHSDWTKRNLRRAEFHPEGREEPSDYNLHYLDVNPPPNAELEFDRRADEIMGKNPDIRVLRLDPPDAHERFLGSVFSAVIGDAMGHGVDVRAVNGVPWRPRIIVKETPKFTDYTFRYNVAPTSGVTPLIAFTLEGLIRAHIARRINPVDNDPTPEVQHAYQRWLYTQRVAWGQHGQWGPCGGPYASRMADPDGWLIRNRELFELLSGGAGQDDVAAVLTDFAERGVRSTLGNTVSACRGSSAVPRAGVAAVWSNGLQEVFAAAVNIAALTHDHPNDYLPAGALAALVHQQIRDVPFGDCVSAVRAELTRWPGHEKAVGLVDRAFGLLFEENAPAWPVKVREALGNGSDGAEALGIALYAAMVSDYVREAVLLAVNYSDSRPATAAIAGYLIGAECGIKTIPNDLRHPLELHGLVEELANDALTEFSPGPPTDPSWTERYPAW